MSGKILVIAATGNVGRPLVAELLRRGEEVKAASRSASAVLPAGAEPVRLDLQDAGSLDAALSGVDRIYALSPTGHLDPFGLLAPLVDTAAARGIKLVLQSAIGVDADDGIPLRRLELLIERSGVPFVILRPNWFSDNFANVWSGGIARGELRLPAGEGKTSFVDARDIAAAAAGALTTDRHDGRTFELTGPSAHDYHEAARLISAAVGRTVVYRPVEASAFVAEAIAGGIAEGYAHLLSVILQPVALGYVATVTDAVETLSGSRPRSLETSIADLAGRLKAAA